jgi:DivIVA domain
MPMLTPADIRNVAFGKPPLGRRGYDEEEVDAFLDDVEHTVTALTKEIAALRAQLNHGGRGGAEDPVLGELDLIKHRLARIEQAVLGHRPY